MPVWGAVLVAVCGGTGIFNVIVAVLQHRWAGKEKEDTRIDALMTAQRVSMEERIRYLVSYYIKKESITMAEKSNLMAMHRAYIGVGGNGNLDPEMQMLGEIPVRG